MSAVDIHPIPPITEPMGRYWEQPDRESILIDDKHAMMSRATMEKLKEYSCSQPSGAYEGKMWRSRDDRGGWYLYWFGVSSRPNMVSNNVRPIILID